MRLFHATPLRNLPSIQRLGILLPHRKPKRIWATTSELVLCTLVEHIATHHGVTPDDMGTVIFEAVPDDVYKCAGKWYGFALLYSPVPPEKIIQIFP